MTRWGVRAAVVLIAAAVGGYALFALLLPRFVPEPGGSPQPGAGAGLPGDVSEAADPSDPWLRQPVLHHLLLTHTGEVRNSAKPLAALLNLTAEEWERLVEVARYEQEALAKVERYQKERTALLGADSVAVQEVLTQVKGDEQRVLNHVDRLVRKLLGGERYAQFRQWVRETWTPTRAPVEGLSNG